MIKVNNIMLHVLKKSWFWFYVSAEWYGVSATHIHAVVQNVTLVCNIELIPTASSSFQLIVVFSNQQLCDCIVSHVGNHLSVCSYLTVVLCPMSVTTWLSNSCMTVLCPMLVTTCLSAATWLWCYVLCLQPFGCPTAVWLCCVPCW